MIVACHGLCGAGSTTFPTGAPPLPVIQEAVCNTVRIVLREAYGTFGTGVIIDSPYDKQGLGAVVVNRHAVSSNALAQFAYFDQSATPIKRGGELGATKLFSSDSLKSPIGATMWQCTMCDSSLPCEGGGYSGTTHNLHS